MAHGYKRATLEKIDKKNATQLAYLQIELRGEVRFEGQSESCLWRAPIREFQYLISQCLNRVNTDLQHLGFKTLDGSSPRQRNAVILTTDNHFKRTFRTPRTRGKKNLSLDEDKNDWQYWLPTYPQEFCEKVLRSFKSDASEDRQRAKEFIANWLQNWKTTQESFQEQA